MPDDGYIPVQEQFEFPVVSLDELAAKVTSKLDGQYHAYEVKDFLDQIGSAVIELMTEGKVVRIKGLGKFYLHTNKAKDFFNVNKMQWFHSHATITPKFKYGTAIRLGVGRAVKQQLISEGKVKPDIAIDPPTNRNKHNRRKNIPIPNPTPIVPEQIC